MVYRTVAFDLEAGKTRAGHYYAQDDILGANGTMDVNAIDEDDAIQSRLNYEEQYFLERLAKNEHMERGYYSLTIFNEYEGDLDIRKIAVFAYPLNY